MADVNNTIKTTVELDVTQAQQEIVRLNARASDSTKTLEQRLEAKNKQIKIEQELVKQNIVNLEKEVTRLVKEGSELSKIENAKKKLNAERIRGTRLLENGAKAQDKLTQSLENSRSATKNLDNATGGLLGKLGAFVANPIGAAILVIVGALKLMYNSLTLSSEGQDLLAKGTIILRSALRNLSEIVSDLTLRLVKMFSEPKQTMADFADAFKKNIETRLQGLLFLIPDLARAFKKLFQGEFVEAGSIAADAVGKIVAGTESLTQSIRDAGKALSDFGKEVAEDARKAAAIADKRAKADQMEIDLITQKAEAERKIAELRDKAVKKDVYNFEQRKNFLREASKINDDIIAKEIQVARIRANAIAEENKLSKPSQEALTEEATLKARIIQLDTERLTLSKTLGTQILAIDKEQAANLKSAADAKEKELESFRKAEEEYDKAQKKKKEQELKEKKEAEEARIAEEEFQIELDEIELERLKDKKEKTLEAEIAILERKLALELSLEDQTATEKLLIQERFNLEKARLEKAEEKATKAKEKAVLNLALDGAAEAFGIAQEVAIAKMIMAAPEAIAGSFKEAAKTYAPPLSIAMGALGAAATVVPIIKGLADIKKARFSGSKKGPSASGSIAAPQSVGSEMISDIAANNASRLGSDMGIGNSASASAANNVVGESSPNVVFSEGKYDNFKEQIAFKEEKTTIS